MLGNMFLSVFITQHDTFFVDFLFFLGFEGAAVSHEKSLQDLSLR